MSDLPPADPISAELYGGWYWRSKYAIQLYERFEGLLRTFEMFPDAIKAAAALGDAEKLRGLMYGRYPGSQDPAEILEQSMTVLLEAGQVAQRISVLKDEKPDLSVDLLLIEEAQRLANEAPIDFIETVVKRESEHPC